MDVVLSAARVVSMVVARSLGSRLAFGCRGMDGSRSSIGCRSESGSRSDDGCRRSYSSRPLQGCRTVFGSRAYSRVSCSSRLALLALGVARPLGSRVALSVRVHPLVVARHAAHASSLGATASPARARTSVVAVILAHVWLTGVARPSRLAPWFRVSLVSWLARVLSVVARTSAHVWLMGVVGLPAHARTSVVVVILARARMMGVAAWPACAPSSHR